MKPNPEVRLLVTSGDGPVECRIAVRKTLLEIRSKAEKSGISCEVELSNTGCNHGPASAVISLSGTCCDEFSRDWVGSVQWIFKSPVRRHHKRRNWFVGVFQINALEVGMPTLNDHDLIVERFRAGGPGGQHQNTTDSAVRVTHKPTGISAISRDERSQHRNRKVALERLINKFILTEFAAEKRHQKSQNQMHKTLERGNPVKVFRV
ncbi:MAG: peptide chain release factor H [Rhizobiaceae bacterium]|nr:peptide chain release factor H [Rhizobiaceae bacterium]